MKIAVYWNWPSATISGIIFLTEYTDVDMLMK